MINMMKVMRLLTEKYEHLAEIRIAAQTDTLEYLAQVKVHPHAKGTINKTFSFRAETTEEEFMGKLLSVCEHIDMLARDIGAVFESPHSPV
jgi:hypothetical protein